MVKAPRPRARRLSAEERRRQILDAAIAVFARSGYRAAGTADIAAAAGIGEPTIYRYFENKRDLYVAAVTRCRTEIMENWQRIIDGSGSAGEALQGIGRWYYEQIQRDPETLMLRFRTLTESSEPEAVELVRDTYLHHQGLVLGLYERAKAEGTLKDDADPNTLAWLFMAVGAIIDVTHLLGLRDEFGGPELEKITQFFGGAAWDGWPEPSQP